MYVYSNLDKESAGENSEKMVTVSSAEVKGWLLSNNVSVEDANEIIQFLDTECSGSIRSVRSLIQAANCVC